MNKNKEKRSMQTSKIKEEKEKKRFGDGFKLWYSYNKFKIPVYFVLLAAVFFTLFMDFETKSFTLNSHLNAIGQVSAKNNIIGFYFFVINIIAIVQIVNVTTYSKKRSPFSLFLLTALTLVQTVLVVLYRSIILSEMGRRKFPQFLPWFELDSGHASIYILLVGAFLMIVGTVFAWIYVDWKYVKVEE